MRIIEIIDRSEQGITRPFIEVREVLRRVDTPDFIRFGGAEEGN
jgi:hypothetical protein